MLGSALCAATPDAVWGCWLLASGAFLIGGAEGAVTVALQTYVAATATENVKGSVMSVLGAANRWGQCSGPLLAGMLLMHYGAPAVYTAQGLVALAAALSSKQFMLYIGADEVVNN